MTSQGDTTPHHQLYLRTPLIESFALSQLAGCRVHLKMENLQPSSSFKMRGLSNAVQKRLAQGYTRIIASSGGNGGFAVACSCNKLKVPMTLFVPETTAEFMKERIRGEGAEVITHGAAWDHSNERAKEEAKQPGCTLVHPFDDPDVWEGNASMIVEVKEDLDEKPDLVVASVGGGGLLTGVIQGLEKVGWGDVPVLAMETVGADCFNQAVKADKLVTLPAITSIAKHLGALTVCQRLLDYSRERTVLSEVVTDAEAVRACLKFLDDHRTLVEPACGAALCAVYSDVIQKLQKEGKLSTVKNVVIIVCGGHAVTMDTLMQWKEKFCPS